MQTQDKGSAKTMNVPPLPDINTEANKLKLKESVGLKDTSVKKMDTLSSRKWKFWDPKILQKRTK